MPTLKRTKSSQETSGVGRRNHLAQMFTQGCELRFWRTREYKEPFLFLFNFINSNRCSTFALAIFKPTKYHETFSRKPEIVQG